MANKPDSTAYALRIKDLHKKFDEKTILSGLTYDVMKGEILGFFGGSGTGKSVILRSIIGLEKPDSGSIEFEGRNIVQLSEEQLIDVRKKIGYVFQNGALFDSLTVEENISYPLREHTKLSEEEISTKVQEMLSLIGLESSQHLLPASLSGGMQKRVGVARSIIMRPDIILYDEPTAGLDPFNTHRLMDLMLEVKSRGHTAIFVTHDLAAAFKVSDRIAVLYKGTIRAIDTVKNIQNSSDPVVHSFLAGEEIK